MKEELDNIEQTTNGKLEQTRANQKSARKPKAREVRDD